MNRYEIRVVGHLGARRVRALGADDGRLLPDGDTALVFAAADLAATYGILARLRDAGLELVSVMPLAAGDPAGDRRSEGARTERATDCPPVRG